MDLLCVICDAVMSANHIFLRVHQNKDLEWRQRIRVVTQHSSQSPGYVSGVGSYDAYNRIYVPLVFDTSEEDPDIDVENLRRYEEVRNMCFCCHEICWDILVRRVSAGRSDIVATRLGNFIHYSQLYKFKLGDIKVRRSSNEIIYWYYPPEDGSQTEDDIFRAEPLQPENMSQLLQSSGIQSYYPPRAHAIPLQGPLGSQDAFQRLPPEIILLLLAMLPRADIKNLRAASRSVASASHPATLPQQFWRSRFSPEFEMGFALPKHITGAHDWRAAYVAVKNALKDPNGSPHLKNRRRIWNKVCASASLFSQFMAGRSFHDIQTTEYRLLTKEEYLRRTSAFPG